MASHFHNWSQDKEARRGQSSQGKVPPTHDGAPPDQPPSRRATWRPALASPSSARGFAPPLAAPEPPHPRSSPWYWVWTHRHLWRDTSH